MVLLLHQNKTFYKQLDCQEKKVKFILAYEKEMFWGYSFYRTAFKTGIQHATTTTCNHNQMDYS